MPSPREYREPRSPRPFVKSLKIDARHPGIDVGEDLVGDRARPLGEVLARDDLEAALAEQHDLVAVVRAVPLEIDHDLVHADASHHRVLLAADDDLGHVRQRAEVAVAVADRNRDDPHGMVAMPGGAVAHGMPGPDDLEIDDAGLPR